MAKEPMLTHIVETVPPADSYGYPTSALVVEFKNDSNRVHLILDDQATPSTDFANAPNGSIFICLTETAGENKIHVKFGAKGKSDGAWKATAQLT